MRSAGQPAVELYCSAVTPFSSRTFFVAAPGRGLGPRGFLTEEEKQNMPVVNGTLIKRILSYLVPYWPQFLLVFLTILLSAVLGLLPSIITGKIVDEALVGKNMALLVRLLVMAFVTLTASQVISVLESYINSWISQRIIFDMKNQMYDHLQHPWRSGLHWWNGSC